MIGNPLLLRNLPLYKCCAHCKDKYCPQRKGHYSVCPIKLCVEGKELHRTEDEKKVGWSQPWHDKAKTGKMLISTSFGTEGFPEGCVCPIHNEIHSAHGWYRCKEA